MAVALITGSAGLIGSEAVDSFVARGFDVVGIDNDMRRQLLRRRGLDGLAAGRTASGGMAAATVTRTSTSATPTR